jgi:hypothetical protein
MTSEDRLVDKLKKIMVIVRTKVGDLQWKLHKDQIDKDDTTNILSVAIDEVSFVVVFVVVNILTEYFNSISLGKTDSRDDIIYIDGGFRLETYSDDVFSINVHVPPGYIGADDLVKRISEELNILNDTPIVK